MTPVITRARLRRAVRRETVGVDVRAALNLVGALLKYLSLSLALPTAFALWYGESPWPFLVAGAVGIGAGWGLELLTQGKETVGAREGFLVVALTWLVAAALGALPYLLSGNEQLSHPVDAYFEAMSGFTTTGSSVLTDFDAVPRSLMMWRQFTQWLGGMGIIVLALAVLPRLRVGGRQLFESEAPGPELEPLAASIRETARRLWLLYFALTALLLLTHLVVGWTGLDPRMTPFNALAHAFTTMPTGGFSPEPRSLEEFAPVTQWVTTGFMALAGANFGLLYLALVRRRARMLVRDQELRLYVLLLAVATAVLFWEITSEDLVAGGEGPIRHATFQVVSLMTTTGYASTDFNEWTPLAAVLLVGLMFVGGSAGSTAGSIKVVRHALIGRILRRELDQTVHPEIVTPIRLNARTVDERAVRAVIAFVLIYVGLFVGGALVITIDAASRDLGVGAFDAIAAAATTLGNVGPGFGFAGPMGSFEPFDRLSQVVMIGLMWLGRLELIPVIVLFTRSYWRA